MRVKKTSMKSNDRSSLFTSVTSVSHSFAPLRTFFLKSDRLSRAYITEFQEALLATRHAPEMLEPLEAAKEPPRVTSIAVARSGSAKDPEASRSIAGYKYLPLCQKNREYDSSVLFGLLYKG